MPIALDDVVKIVENEGLEYSIIRYPEKTRKSIDIIVTMKDSKKVVIKASSDKISKDEINDLKKFASIVGSIPLIITEEAEEDIAIDKGNIFGISLQGFERIINGDKIFVYRTRGGMFVKIRPEVLKRKREEMNYSMGDVAKMLGVSRKAIYDYENGESDVSIEIAEKLIDIFGPEIIGDICDSKIDERKIEYEEDHKVIRLLKSAGFKAVLLKLTAIDIIGANEEKKRKLGIIIEPKRQDTSEKKIHEGGKIASDFNLKLIIVTRSSVRAKELEKEGFQVYLDQNLDSLRDEFKTD